jgi:uncharacterized protein
MSPAADKPAARPGRVRAVVVYARPAGSPGRTFVRQVEVPAGSTLADAVDVSGLLKQEPALAGRPLDVGVFGRVRSPQTELRDGDRVEVYRPLTIDPKEARRVRAEVRARTKRQEKGKGRG